MSIPKAFNKIFISLIDDCILVFPEDNDLKNYKKGAKILDQFNDNADGLMRFLRTETYKLSPDKNKNYDEGFDFDA